MTINPSAPDETTSAAWKRSEKIQTFIMAAGLVTTLVGVGMWYAGNQEGEPIAAAGMAAGTSVALGRMFMREYREMTNAPARPAGGGAAQHSGRALTP